mgnify:FL=1
MKKKKVMFFIYRMGSGGAARTLLNILNHLDRQKFTPILVTLNFNGNYEPYLSSDIEFIKLKTKRLRAAILPLARLIRQERPDILFSTIPVYNTVAILGKLLSFTKTKLIVREAALLGGSPRENATLRLFGCLYRFASKVIALSQGVKENLVKRYRVKEEKIQVVYNPIDIDNIQQLAEHGEMPDEHREIFNNNSKIIVTAGRLVDEKDQKTLIKAFAKVQKRLDCELIILGEGEREYELKEIAKQLAVQHNVHFLGFQQNPYVYFKNADLFVLSSLREGFGHVLVESLAVGTPVVTTNCKPGAEEVLQNGEFGQITPVGDVDALADEIYASLQLGELEKKHIIQKGIERANDFAAPTIVRQYEAIFHDVVEQKRSDRQRS